MPSKEPRKENDKKMISDCLSTCVFLSFFSVFLSKHRYQRRQAHVQSPSTEESGLILVIARRRKWCTGDNAFEDVRVVARDMRLVAESVH